MISLQEFQQQWLESVRADNPSTTMLGNRFAEKILRDWHEIDEDTAEIILCDGAGDGGIDAAVFVKSDPDEGVDGDTWYLVQSKYGTAFQGGGTITEEAHKLFATLQGERERLSSLSRELISRLRTFLANKGPKDRLEYVLATVDRLTPEQAGFLDSTRILGRSKFGECFEVEDISVETIYNKVVEEAQEDAKRNLLLVPLKTKLVSSGALLHVGATPLPDLYSFMKAYREKTGDLDLIYERNVRKFLGNKRKVNRGIEETLDKHPERFGLYNNGITIVAEGVTKHGETVDLINPFIVNGCQTTKSIWAVLQRKLDAGGSAPTAAHKDWVERLSSAVVITKIVVAGSGNAELLTETTRFTNSQNAVSEKDFIALEKDFRAWAPAFNARFHIFLEIQRGAWEARKAFQRQRPQAERFEEHANAFDLLKAYAAGWLREPGIAFGKNPPFAPTGTFFNKITRQDGFGVDDLFAAYQLHQLADHFKFGRGAPVQSRRQTRFLFIMVAVALIRDVIGNTTSNVAVTKALLLCHKHGYMKALGDAAAALIDDYLSPISEESYTREPEYQRTSDLNAFLKSERLGKHDENSTPKLNFQMGLAKRMFRRTPEATALQEAYRAAEMTEAA